MAGFREQDKQHFPLENIRDLVTLFKDHLRNNDEPNLAILSIIVGAIENKLTVNRSVQNDDENSGTIETSAVFPVLELSIVEALFTKFVSHVKSFVDLSKFPSSEYTCRDLVKRVSDVIWSSLSRAYHKDKAHLQSLYSLLTGNKLDCFGVAFSVVAACQVLGLNDVHLALSEDHAWVVFGENGSESAEITWHGKGNEDKRGQPIHIGVAEKSWLYLNGHAVVCNRHMEVAALVSAINPSISSSADSVEMSSLQQELLWLLYDTGHLAKYPMALGNLGELEDLTPTPGRIPALQLYQEAIDSARVHYNKQHVYPYMYISHYYHRKACYKEALRNWAEAASVIRQFNYNREDEEIYKKFFEIANDTIPHIMKLTSADMPATQKMEHMKAALSTQADPECFASFLKFYDGICQWEEGSATPVLHVGWATHLVFSLSRFNSTARTMVDLHAEGEEDKEDEGDDDDKDNTDEEDNAEKIKDVSHKIRENGRVSSDCKESVSKTAQDNVLATTDKSEVSVIDGDSSSSSTSKENGLVNGGQEKDKIKNAIEELESKVGDENQNETQPNPNIAALAQACGDSILNPEYLLCGGEPFTAKTQDTVNNNHKTAPDSASDNTNLSSAMDEAEIKVDYKEFLSSKANGSTFVGMTMDSVLKAESPADAMFRKRTNGAALDCDDRDRQLAVVETGTEEHDLPEDSKDHNGGSFLLVTDKMNEHEECTPVLLTKSVLLLHSQKMKGLKSILNSCKVNSSAIKLQLTAQSQVFFKTGGKRGSESDHGIVTRKRTRKE